MGENSTHFSSIWNTTESMWELHSSFTGQCHRSFDAEEMNTAPVTCRTQCKREKTGPDYHHCTNKYPKLTKRCTIHSGNKAPAPSAGERVVAAQPGTTMLSWSDTTFSQEINLQMLIFPGKYQQGCDWASLAESAYPRPESLPWYPLPGGVHPPIHCWMCRCTYGSCSLIRGIEAPAAKPGVKQLGDMRQHLPPPQPFLPRWMRKPADPRWEGSVE